MYTLLCMNRYPISYTQHARKPIRPSAHPILWQKSSSDDCMKETGEMISLWDHIHSIWFWCMLMWDEYGNIICSHFVLHFHFAKEIVIAWGIPCGDEVILKLGIAQTVVWYDKWLTHTLILILSNTTMINNLKRLLSSLASGKPPTPVHCNASTQCHVLFPLRCLSGEWTWPPKHWHRYVEGCIGVAARS